MEFLKDSWDNLAENENVEDNLLENLEHALVLNLVDSDQFQIILSKKQKKILKEAYSSKKRYNCKQIKGFLSTF